MNNGIWPHYSHYNRELCNINRKAVYLKDVREALTNLRTEIDRLLGR